MSRSDYLVGSVFLAGTLTAVVAAAWFVVSRRLSHLTGAIRWTALGIVGFGALTAACLVPGALGILSRETVLGAAVALALAAWRLTAGGHAPEAARAGPESGWASWAIACLGAGLVGVCTVAFGAVYADVPTVTIDMVSFHLPNVARWIDSGSFWQIDDFVADWPFGYYPSNGDMLLLAVVQPFENDFLVRLVNFPLLGLTGLATYATGRELGAPAATAVLAAAALLAIPMVTFIGLEGLPDTFMLATMSAGVSFLVRHARTRARSDLVLASLGLGLALGTKWYALPAVAVVAAVWGVAWSLNRHRPARPVREAFVALGVVSLSGGFWLLRNLAESGNPVFPQKISPLGLTIFDAPQHDVREEFGATIADYLFDADVWDRYFLPAFRRLLTGAALALALAAALAVVVDLAGRRQGRRGEDRVPMLATCALLVALAYVFLPFTAQGPEGQPVDTGANIRYVLPAFVLAAPLAAWAGGRLRPKLRLAVEAVLLVGLVDGVIKTFDLPSGAVAKTALVLALAGLAAYRLAPTLGRLSARGRQLAVGAAVLVLLATAGAVGWSHQRAFNDGRYQGVDPTGDWLLANAGAERRIGIAGLGFSPDIWLSFGPRLENEVEYVGQRKKGMLRPYEQRGDLARAIRQGRYDALLVLLAGPLRNGLSNRQDAWIRDDGWREVARGASTRVYLPPEPR